MLTGEFVTVTTGSGTLTLTASEPAIRITGSLTITLEPDTIAAVGHIGGTREPPWLAESLLCIFARVARAKDIDALMGDFAELFERDCASGLLRRRAVARYWARVIRSIGTKLWQAVRRVGLIIGLIIAELLRR